MQPQGEGVALTGLLAEPPTCREHAEEKPLDWLDQT